MPLFALPNLTLLSKWKILCKFLVIDWYVLHSHKPQDILLVCQMLVQRRAQQGEIMVESGCYNGGSSAKFSLLCSLTGYNLHIYDSFEGVEQMSEEEKKGSYDFSGQYAATEQTVQQNIVRYGKSEVCTLHKGWFSETLAATPLKETVRVAYIDCDLAKGTYEALIGIVPALAYDGCIVSQDYHIAPVRDLLHDTNTWRGLHKEPPQITKKNTQLALLRFPEKKSTQEMVS